MLHPHFDPSDLTDDQLYDKLNTAYTYLSQQSALGHNPTIASIEQTIMALESEKVERFEKMMAKENEQAYTEELKPINLGTIEGEDNDESR